MRALVTGATGKVGNAVTRKLLDRGDEVVALVRDPQRAAHTLPDGVQLAQGDVTDEASCRRGVEGVDGVFNCMGIYEQWVRDTGIFDRVNAQGARNVIAAARDAGVPRAVHTSTFDVFHAEPGGTVDERKLADYPKSTAYERSKQHAEQLVLEEARHGIEVVITNPGGVYGPGPWARFGFDSAIRDAVRRRLPAAPPGGTALGYVEDVAEAHLTAFDRGVPGERYLLAGPYAEAREILTIAVEAAGRGRVPPTMPESVAKALAGIGEGISRLIRRPPLLPLGQLRFLLWRVHADCSKAQRELGYRVRPIERGIDETVRWMAESGKL